MLYVPFSGGPVSGKDAPPESRTLPSRRREKPSAMRGTGSGAVSLHARVAAEKIWLSDV